MICSNKFINSTDSPRKSKIKRSKITMKKKKRYATQTNKNANAQNDRVPMKKKIIKNTSCNSKIRSKDGTDVNESFSSQKQEDVTPKQTARQKEEKQEHNPGCSKEPSLQVLPEQPLTAAQEKKREEDFLRLIEERRIMRGGESSKGSDYEEYDENDLITECDVCKNYFRNFRLMALHRHEDHPEHRDSWLYYTDDDDAMTEILSTDSSVIEEALLRDDEGVTEKQAQRKNEKQENKPGCSTEPSLQVIPEQPLTVAQEKKREEDFLRLIEERRIMRGGESSKGSDDEEYDENDLITECDVCRNYFRNFKVMALHRHEDHPEHRDSWHYYTDEDDAMTEILSTDSSVIEEALLRDQEGVTEKQAQRQNEKQENKPGCSKETPLHVLPKQPLKAAQEKKREEDLLRLIEERRIMRGGESSKGSDDEEYDENDLITECDVCRNYFRNFKVMALHRHEDHPEHRDSWHYYTDEDDAMTEILSTDSSVIEEALLRDQEGVTEKQAQRQNEKQENKPGCSKEPSLQLIPEQPLTAAQEKKREEFLRLIEERRIMRGGESSEGSDDEEYDENELITECDVCKKYFRNFRLMALHRHEDHPEHRDSWL